MKVMLPRLQTKEDVQIEIVRLESDAMNYDEIGFQFPEPNHYLHLALRIRTMLIPELHKLLDSEEYQ